VSDSKTHSTLRELRDHISQPTALIVLAGIAGVLTITAPFDTGTALRFVPRLVYWFCASALTYCVGFLATGMVERHLGHWPRPALMAAMGLVAGLAISMVVLGANFAVFGIWPRGQDMLIFLATIFSIAFIITMLMAVLSEQIRPASDEPPKPPALLDRLPFDKRAALVSVSVEDHYVRVRTLKGEEMVLMRLGDAMKEVGDVAGLQVHRSHWVALDQVRSAIRQGDRAILTMVTGEEVPVSRTYLPAIKEAGLLPVRSGA